MCGHGHLLPAGIMAMLLYLVVRMRWGQWVGGDARGHQELLSRIRGPLGAEDPRVVATVRAHYLFPPSHLPYNLTHRYHYENSHLSHAFGWGFYHHYIRHFFGNQRGGFFLEAGALDGEFLSNSLWLELNLGWSGLLIEADRNNFRHLLWKRRRAWISNTCVAKESYPREAIFESLEETKGESRWIYRANTRETGSYFTKFLDELSRSSRRSYTRTQCFPLTTHLLALNVTTIDLLSLDMQGGEWEVIRGLPLEKVLVRSMAVEHFPGSETDRKGAKFDQAFVRYMEGLGYRLVDVNMDVDYFFILTSDQVLKHKSDPRELNQFHKKT
ncbi:protein Star-like [Panulirus ornatus]|uniref:protein Star-like n=1 Tax=Panulirus ornatus TaxID=150431 RepID=UPI003A841A62